MKNLLLLLLTAFIFSPTYSQFIYKIKADSVLITNDSCTAELIIENSTKNVKGFLVNKGNGRTEFRRAEQLTDSSFAVGGDTIVIRGFGNYIFNDTTIVQDGGFNINGKVVFAGKVGIFDTLRLENVPIGEVLDSILVKKADGIVRKIAQGSLKYVDSLSGNGIDTLRYRIDGLFRSLIMQGRTPASIEKIIDDSIFNGYEKIGIKVGVAYPTVPTTLNDPIIWHWLGTDSRHDQNFIKDSMTASIPGSKTLRIWLGDTTQYVMYGVAVMDDKFAAQKILLGTGVETSYIDVGANYIGEIGGYGYTVGNTVTIGTVSYSGGMTFQYDTATGILTVPNNLYGISQEVYNLSIEYGGDNAYHWRRMRNTLPQAEPTSVKYQLCSNITDDPILGSLDMRDMFFFKGNNVVYAINLNVWDTISNQLIFYNSNIWVMYVYKK